MNPESTARAREVIRLNDSIYQLYRPSGSRSMQVVFFHGFQLEDYESAHMKTWTLGDGSVWPQTWLVDEFPEAHVLSVSYNRWVTNDRDGGTMDLNNICDNLTSDLLRAPLYLQNRGEEPRCPIILVGHSFGGLVLKQLCVHVSNRKACERDSSTKSSLEDFLNDVKGIFFYGTPHHGISKEALAVFTVENQSLLKYVKTLSIDAARTESSFSPLTEMYKWHIEGLGESLPLKRSGFPDLEVAGEASSRYGSIFNIAGDTDHITITRPRAKNQRNFTALVDLLNSIKRNGVELERPVHQSQGSSQHHAHLVKSSRECGIPTELQPAAERRCIVAAVNDIDGLYVPISKPQSAVIEAIEDLQGPSVILLHGGVGKGKSTLARSMIQRYGIQKDATDGKAFDNVFWVSCANCSKDEISSKQLEILQDHSPNSLADSPLEEKTNLSHKIAKVLQEFFDDKKILMILDDVSDVLFLREMWEAATGGKASAGGKGVKILVTSRWENICAKAGLKQDSCLIFMEDPLEDEAMKILACLVGLEGKYIPHHLQPTAKDMIKVTERNPLALACLASQFIYTKDIEDQQAWQDTLKGLRKLLDSSEGKLVLPVTEPGKHDDPRSLHGAIKLCIDSLETDDAKKILFFMYAFKEESVPELVLRILYGSLKRSNCTFSSSTDELDMRELLKIHKESQQPPSLSLRSLVKLYMEHTKMVGENEIKSLVDELLHDIEQAPQLSSAEIKQGDETGRVEWDKARAAVTLSALYFNRDDAGINTILTQALTRANVTYSNDGINNLLRRQAIYPILSLMHEPEDVHWKESNVSYARQVFLTYICKRELDDENISHLLELATSTTAQLATLKAIGRIFTIEKGPLLKDNHLNFLQALVHLLDVNRGLPTSLLEEASKTLCLVCRKAAKDQSTSLVTNIPGVLDMLVSLISFPIQWPTVVAEHALKALRYLSRARIAITTNQLNGALVNVATCLLDNGNPGLQEAAAGILGNLACSSDRSLKHHIANHEGVIHSLVKLMSSQETPTNVQAEATRALGNLASATDNVLKLWIVNEEGALEGLVKLLSMHNKPETQEYATAALGNVACSSDRSLKRHIANHEGVIHSLVKLMSSHETPSNLQSEATRALGNLAIGEDDVLKLQIMNESGALEGLVKLLSLHDKCKTQEHAAAGLGNLACNADSSLKVRIANHEGVLHNLVKLMSSYETPAYLQEIVTWALGNLASAADNVLKLRIVNEEGALEGLVKLLSTHDKPITQEHAAAGLGNLACNAHSSLKVRIANHEGVIHNLVKLMSSNETFANVRKEATRALRTLASTANNVLKLRIVNEEGALEGLVKLLSTHDKPNTQEHAVATLGSLACNADSSLKVRIANYEGVLHNLVKLMSSHETPANVQGKATWALQCLASATDNLLKLQIVNQEGALEGLVKLLSMHDKPNTQKHAAAGLGNLACNPDRSLALQIANHEGVVQNLVKLMSSNETLANVQVEATRALRNLASTTNNVLKLQIVNEEGALEGLVKLLSMHDKPETQEHATATLGNVACSSDRSLNSHIANHEGVVHNLLKLMSSHETPINVQAEATRALGNLAISEDDLLKLQIVNEEGALEGLVKLISTHDKPKIQEYSTTTLGNLVGSSNRSLKHRIVSHEGVVYSLVKLMSSHETPTNVQAEATRALCNLANGADDILKLQIVNQEGALEGLVKLLSTHDKPKTQEHAAAALGSLACNADSSLKIRIANYEGVLHNLVKLMSSHETPSNVQAEATRALGNLASATDNVLKLRIVNEERALEGLVKLLSMHDKPKTQEHAAGALGNLAHRPDRSLKGRIANHEGVVHSLVKLMSSHETPTNVQAEVTRALGNLAIGEDDVLKLQIVNEEGALEGLVKLLCMHNNPNTQEHAAASLGNLASNADSSLNVRIANHEGVLHNLVKLMSSNETFTNVRVEATLALRILANTEDDVLKLRIVNEEGALEGLVKLLSTHDKSITQEHAAAGLGNLACCADSSLKVRIANHEGVIHNLVKLMNSHESLPNVQAKATRALQLLANTEDDVLKLRIVNEEGALEGLVKLLPMHDKPNTQEHAATGLGNLACNADSSLKVRIANHEGVLHNLVKLMSSSETLANVRVVATRALRILANTEDDVLKLRIVNEEGALEGLVNLLSTHDKPNTPLSLAVHDHPILQEHAGWVLYFLAKSEEAKVILEGREGLLKGLSSLLADGVASETQYIGAHALTLINPTIGKEASLTSKEASLGRIEAFIFMGMFEEALHDLGFAVDLLQGANRVILCWRLFVKAKLGDLDGALEDANEAVKVSNSDGKSYALQERGVVKQMLGDLEGSLADLNEALKLNTEEYEILKYRGRVKFMLRDEEGARADAELALKIKPPRVDVRGYGREPVLGCCPTEYLGYKLK